MKKKGQITIFIIIAILLIAGVALFFTFREKIIPSSQQESNPVFLFVQSCIEDVGQDAIYYVIKNGGYGYSPAFSTSTGIPYYYSNGRSYMPSKGTIEEEISLYLEESLPFCINGFENFPEYDILAEDVNAMTMINDETITFNVEYPLAIKKGDDVIRLTNFNSAVNIRIGAVYDVIEEFIEEQTEYDSICLSCISDLALKNDLRIDMTNIDEGIIFSVRDEYPKIKDVPIEWRFANRY